MSLRLLLDEDSQAKYLVNLLQASQHEVLTVNEVNLAGQPDPVVLSYAKQQGYVLLTRNCNDFQELHLADPSHSGILAIFQNADKSKNMSYKDIIRAISNLEKSELSLENQFVILNQWNY
ncbi:MAG: DUF5615 family PIN-like protein [Pseudanabaenales cyanobacterium]|nr:DUF5615 family PIN-like protein [Pseudanabaenales cyanobacterium]